MNHTEIVQTIEAIVAALPEARRAKLLEKLGAPLSEGTYLVVDIPEECVTLTGLVIAGPRDPDGAWDLSGSFAMLADDGERYRMSGWACDITEIREGRQREREKKGAAAYG